MQQPASPSPAPRGSLAFKPPSRPGASLRGRQSTAALSEVNLNSNHGVALPPADMGDAEKASLQSSSEAQASGASSPSSSSMTEDGKEPSARETQLLVATQSARQRLKELAQSTDSQTTAAGLLGQGLIEQSRRIQALRQELSALDDDEDSLGAEENGRIEALTARIEEEVQAMNAQKSQLLSDLMPSSGLPRSESMFSHSSSTADMSGFPRSSSRGEVSIMSPGKTTTPTARQSDRRARNAAAPSSIQDQALVNQLQEGLVQEIRRLQGLLGERDRQLKANEEEKKRVDEELGLWKPKAMSLMEREDALKQESWDLQVEVQDLRGVLHEERATVKKLDTDRTRTAKELTKLQEMADERKVQLEAQAAELERIKTLRETDTALARKEKATLQREYSDLQNEANKFKAQAQKLERTANMSRSASISILGPDHTMDEQGADQAAGDLTGRLRDAAESDAAKAADHSEEGSFLRGPAGTPGQARDRDVADLRGKLAIAQKKTGKDAAEKRKLRDQLTEMRKMMAAAGLSAPVDSDVESSDDDDQNVADSSAWVDEGSGVVQKGSNKKRSAGRMPKSSTRPNIASRFGLGPSKQERSGDIDESFDNESLEGEAAEERDDLDELDPSLSSANRKERRRSTLKPAAKRFSSGSSLVDHAPLSELDNALAGDANQSIAESEDGLPSRMPTALRGAGHRMRPASAVVNAGALGNELDFGEDSGEGSIVERSGATELQEANSAAVEGEVPVVESTPAREMNEQGAQTVSLEELLAPALAARQAEHEEAVAALKADFMARQEEQIAAVRATDHARHEEEMDALRTTGQAQLEEEVAALKAHHKSQIDELVRSHDELHEQLRQQHKAELGQLATTHASTLQAREARAADATSKLEQQHETTLDERTESHRAALAAALASQSANHDGAMSEARTRHAQALAEQVAAHSTALAEAEGRLHERLAERERLHKLELSKHQHRHQQALQEQGREHQAMVEDINATNDAYNSQRDAAYNAALEDRDEQIIKGRTEIRRLREEMDAISAQLAEARRQLAEARQEQDRQIRELEVKSAGYIAALEAADAQAEGFKRDVQDANEREALALAEAQAAKAEAESVADSHRGPSPAFEDAVDEPQASPEVEQEQSVPKVAPAEMRESGMQTDDDAWAKYQQEQLALRPSAIPVGQAGETTTGAGGITYLGAPHGVASRGRESVGTFGELVQPTEYTASAVDPTRRGSEAATQPDTTKPPMLAVPPPPTEAPPRGLQARRSAASTMTASNKSSDNLTLGVPARPSSPPPSKLVERASRASFGVRSTGEGDLQEFGVPASPRKSARPSNAAASANSRGKMSRQSSNVSGVSGRMAPSEHEVYGTASIMSRLSQRQAPGRRQSEASNVTSEMSPRASYSRREDYDDEEVGDVTVTAAQGGANGQPQQRLNATGLDAETTDPQVISAITQTMIGEYLFKYTRKTMGRAGHSEKRHRRYFWVHPYTKTLYWTITDPGGAHVTEGVTKSACIEDVRVVEDLNPSPAGLYHLSIVIQTAARQLKITAPNQERHDVWLHALGYLVNRNGVDEAKADVTATASDAASIMRPRSRASTAAYSMSRRGGNTPARSYAASGFNQSSDSLDFEARGDGTPRTREPSATESAGAQSATSYKSKRRNTAAREYLAQLATFQRNVDDWGRRTAAGTPVQGGRETPSTSASDVDDTRLKTAEEMLEENEQLKQEGYEGLDNVRACCGGRHDVGSLAHKGQHHHHGTKGRRGSNAASGGATSPRPSSRLSFGSGALAGTGRGRGTGSMVTTSTTTTDRSLQPSLRVASPEPPLSTSTAPQLGPLSLNAPRASEPLSKMFAMDQQNQQPERPPSAAAGGRPKSPFGSLRSRASATQSLRSR